MKNILYIILILILYINPLLAQNKLQKVTLLLSPLDQLQFAGYYMAKEKGFYKDVGLEIDIKKYKNIKTSLQNVVKNEATYSIGNSSLIIEISKGTKIMLISAIFQTTPVVVLKDKDKGDEYDFYSNILFTSKNEIINHTKRSKNFRDASLKGWEYAFNHIDEIASFIFKNYNPQHISKKLLIAQAHQLKKLAYYKTNKIGLISNYKIEKIYKLYDKQGLITNKLDINNFIFYDNNFVSFTAKEKAYIAKKQIIRYVYDPDWRPFEWKNGLNKHMGIISDILKIVIKKSGLRLKAINSSTWLESTQLIKNHQADMYSAIPKTKEREKTLKFTSSDIYSYTAVFVSHINNKELILNDINYNIKGKKVGIIRGNSLGNYIKKRYRHADFLELKSLKEGFDAIRDKKIDFFVINAVSANYYINNKGYTDTKIYANADYVFRLKIALQKNMPDELVSILNKTLKSISNDDKEAIFVKWITMKMQKTTDWYLIWEIVIISLIILSFLSYIVYLQTKHNKNLTQEISERKLIENKLAILNKELDKRIETATKELKYKNENFKELLNSTMEMIIISDEKQNIIEANEITINFSKKHNFKLRNLFENLDKANKEKVKKALDDNFTKPYEIDLFISKSEPITLLVSGKNITRDNRNMRISTLLDITELKQTQYQLIQQTRLAQMGEMISMIAHQWRQPLSAISATSGSLTLKARRNNLDNEIVMKLSKSITEYAQHLSTTIDDFRNFFKENKQKEEVALEEIVQSTLNIVKMSLANANIKIVTNFANSNKIYTYANEVKQVVLNIIKNSEDVLIEKNIQNPQITINLEKTTITIKDNAGGIPKDIIGKIFEPYFSTKTKKDGTGLGLYMSKTIIEDHCHGKINVYNDEYGAVFKIEL